MGQGGCPVSCIPIEVWTYAADSAFAVNGPFKRASQIVDYFAALIGPFPYSRLTHVQSSTIFGGMENSTAIFYDENAYRNAYLSESTVAHETAHQWFGDAITERNGPIFGSRRASRHILPPSGRNTPAAIRHFRRR